MKDLINSIVLTSPKIENIQDSAPAYNIKTKNKKVEFVLENFLFFIIVISKINPIPISLKLIKISPILIPILMNKKIIKYKKISVFSNIELTKLSIPTPYILK